MYFPHTGLSTGAIVGIAIGSTIGAVAIIVIVIVMVVVCLKVSNKQGSYIIMSSLFSLHMSLFSLSLIGYKSEKYV